MTDLAAAIAYQQQQAAQLPTAARTAYPDHRLIANLSAKYLCHGIGTLSRDEETDLINHLRQAHQQYLELHNSVIAALILLPPGGGKQLLEDAIKCKSDV
ncbi:hypothetical protein [Desulfuromonas thiophila]|uniref:hypothetical protein n=1 Tax=Desulfuromonas thiophila TaxID=57664 RepID=UPI0029F52E96|nr:hypothetical protein [Desulfuromonas thiophila]